MAVSELPECAKILELTWKLVKTYYDNISSRRVVSNAEPGYLRKILPASPPEKGEPWADIQKDIETKIMPGITHWQHPNFMGFFPASSSFPGMLGEMWSAALNGPGFNWICSPVATELETVMLDWLAQAFGLPDRYHSTGPTRGGGVIHGTASEAIVTTMVAAREKYLRETTTHLEGNEEERNEAMAAKRSNLVALASGATHSSAKKAALIAGVRFHAIPGFSEHWMGSNRQDGRKRDPVSAGKGLGALLPRHHDGHDRHVRHRRLWPHLRRGEAPHPAEKRRRNLGPRRRRVRGRIAALA